jgi:hypothetical protein
LFVYNSAIRTKSLKYLIKKHFKKVKCLKRVVLKFGLSPQIIKQFIVDKKNKQIALKNSRLFYHFDLFNLLFCKYFLLSVVNKNNYNRAFFNKLPIVLKLLLNLQKKSFYFKKIQKKNNFATKLRRVCGLVKIKLLSVSIENIIFKNFKYFFCIKLAAIFSQKGLVLKNQISEKYKKQKYVIHTIILSVFYMNTTLISDHLSFLLGTVKQHKKILKDFVDILENLFFLNVIKLRGFQLRVSGKLGGKMRKSKYHYKLGKVQLGSLNYCLNYNLGLSYTKFGVISVKILMINDCYKV